MHFYLRTTETFMSYQRRQLYLQRERRRFVAHISPDDVTLDRQHSAFHLVHPVVIQPVKSRRFGVLGCRISSGPESVPDPQCCRVVGDGNRSSNSQWAEGHGPTQARSLTRHHYSTGIRDGHLKIHWHITSAKNWMNVTMMLFGLTKWIHSISVYRTAMKHVECDMMRLWRC